MPEPIQGGQEPQLTTKTKTRTKAVVTTLAIVVGFGLIAAVGVIRSRRDMVCSSGSRAGVTCRSHRDCQATPADRSARCIASTAPSPTPTPSPAVPTGVCNNGPNSGRLCNMHTNCQPDTTADSRGARCLPFTPGMTNSVASAERIFVGLYDNTKYNLILDDPEGMRQFLFTKANGESIFGGGNPTDRSCLTHIEQHREGVGPTATLLPSDFPLSVSVIDCGTPPAVSLLTIPMPPAP